MPSSGSAHNSQFPPHQIFPPPNPAPRQAARSPAQSFLLPLSPSNHSPECPPPHPPTPLSRPRSRYPPPAPMAPSHNSQESIHFAPIRSASRRKHRRPHIHQTLLTKPVEVLQTPRP